MEQCSRRVGVGQKPGRSLGKNEQDVISDKRKTKNVSSPTYIPPRTVSDMLFFPLCSGASKLELYLNKYKTV